MYHLLLKRLVAAGFSSGFLISCMSSMQGHKYVSLWRLYTKNIQLIVPLCLLNQFFHFSVGFVKPLGSDVAEVNFSFYFFSLFILIPHNFFLIVFLSCISASSVVSGHALG